MTRLLAIGLGYCARHLIGTAPASFSAVTGTSRSSEGAAAIAALARPGLPVDALVFDGSALSADLAQAVAASEILLLSAPPGAAGDPLLAVAREAVLASPALRQIVYLTTLGVYGDHGGAWVDETAPAHGGSARLARRLAAEADLLRLGAQKGIPVAILRLAGIYGPGRNALLQLAQGEARRIHKPGQVFNRIHVTDVAATIRAVVSTGFGGLLNVADDLPAPQPDPVTFAADLLGIAPPPLVPFAEAAARMSPMALSFWNGNKRVSNRLLRETHGVRLAYPTYREGLTALREAGEGTG